MKEADYTVYTDGASKGNPGPASLGVVIERQGQPWKTYRHDLGVATNNEAEYEAVIFALKKLKQLLGKTGTKTAVIEFRADSNLLVSQVNHEHKIEQPGMQHRFMTIWNLLIDFSKVRFTYVPREHNRHADALANGRQETLV